MKSGGKTETSKCTSMYVFMGILSAELSSQKFGCGLCLTHYPKGFFFVSFRGPLTLVLIDECTN